MALLECNVAWQWWLATRSCSQHLGAVSGAGLLTFSIFYSLLPVLEALMYCVCWCLNSTMLAEVLAWPLHPWNHFLLWLFRRIVVMSGCGSILIVGGGNLVTLAVFCRGKFELLNHFAMNLSNIDLWWASFVFVICGVARVDISIQLAGVVCLSWVWVVRLGWCSSPISRCCLLYHQVWILFKF